MAQYCLIIGTRLALHRDVLAGTLGELRPSIPLHVLEPHQIDASIPCRAPRLVIASDRETIARLRPFAWILLFPGEQDLAIASVSGRLRRICAASIDDLLAVIDEAWHLHTPASRAGSRHT